MVNVQNGKRLKMDKCKSNRFERRYGKKGVSVGINTIFYVMMAIIFIWIIIFGISKVSQSSDLISEQERLKVINQLKVVLEYCADDLNRGSSKLINLNHDAFNSVCLLGTDETDLDYFDVFDSSISEDLRLEFDSLKESGDNVLLLQTTYLSGSDNVGKAQIVDSFKIDTRSIETSKCFIDEKNDGKLDLVFFCE